MGKTNAEYREIALDWLVRVIIDMDGRSLIINRIKAAEVLLREVGESKAEREVREVIES